MFENLSHQKRKKLIDITETIEFASLITNIFLTMLWTLDFIILVIFSSRNYPQVPIFWLLVATLTSWLLYQAFHYVAMKLGDEDYSIWSRWFKMLKKVYTGACLLVLVECLITGDLIQCGWHFTIALIIIFMAWVIEVLSC